jgi:2-oxoglutarate ferredoxin oxidoreductase subunit alpha
MSFGEQHEASHMISHRPSPNRTNDFAFKLANVNGTGSASANGLLMQAIFRMGVPVSGKNLFPSNIQGLPTWYEIRVNGHGHTARTADYELIVAMNAETYARDVREVRPGGWLLYDSTWPRNTSADRTDVTFLGVPYAALCNEAFTESRERTLMKNIAYAGTLAALLDIDMAIVQEMLKEKFAKKPALMESNSKAIKIGYDYARAHFGCPLPIHLEKMEATKSSILIDGNTATALGALYAGCTVAAWYPITPSTSVFDAFTALCARYRTDRTTGERRYCILQAEDELAAVGMVIGAAWNGARSFTSTSGPGISLMNELVGLAYYAEIPIVIVDVQRVGPSTGMPTRTQQGDILACAYASHGDTKHICLYPGNPEECFYLMVKAFDLAERFQAPVFMLSDLDIGMNDWVVPSLRWDDAYRPDRGRVLSKEQVEALPKYYRYSPEDELGVAARTVPGVHEKAAFFTRGSGHNKLGGYTEIPDEYQDVMDRLARKHRAARNLVPEAIIERRPHARCGVVTIGGCDLAVREALATFASRGVAADYMRIRGFPFGDEVEAFLSCHETLFVVEQNRDGQLRTLLAMETGTPKDKLNSIRHYGGFPLQASQVVSAMEALLDGAMNVATAAEARE